MKKVILAVAMVMMVENSFAQNDSFASSEQWLDTEDKNLYIFGPVKGLNPKYPDVEISEMLAWYYNTGWVYTRGYTCKGDDQEAFVTQTGIWRTNDKGMKIYWLD